MVAVVHHETLAVRAASAQRGSGVRRAAGTSAASCRAGGGAAVTFRSEHNEQETVAHPTAGNSAARTAAGGVRTTETARRYRFFVASHIEHEDSQ
jgi:hypothetical protein